MTQPPATSPLLPRAQSLLSAASARQFDAIAMREAVAFAADIADREELARALLTAYLASKPDHLEDPDLATDISMLMVVSCGWEAVSAALADLAQVHKAPATQWVLMSLADAIRMEFGEMGLKPSTSKSTMNPLMAALDDGEKGRFDLAYEFTVQPGPPRAVILPAFLRTARGRQPLAPLVGLLALSPPDDATAALTSAWLAKEAGQDGAWLLALLDGKQPDGPIPARWRTLPATWPPHEAFASFPDGTGTQVVGVMRKREDGRFGTGIALVNDWLGVINAGCELALSDDEARTLLTNAASGLPLVSVPAAYVQARVLAAVEFAEEKGLPLPLGLRASGGMFLALAEEPPPDVLALARDWADPAAGTGTAELLERDVAVGWYPDDRDPRVTTAFYVAAITSEEPDLARWLPIFFDEEMRRAWHGRLAHAAYLFDRTGDAGSRRLAATAAVAMAPDSDVPLMSQAFPIALLRRAVAYRVEAMRAGGMLPG